MLFLEISFSFLILSLLHYVLDLLTLNSNPFKITEKYKSNNQSLSILLILKTFKIINCLIHIRKCFTISTQPLISYISILKPRKTIL